MKREIIIFVIILVFIWLLVSFAAGEKREIKISPEVREKTENGEARVFINIKEDKKEEIIDVIGEDKIKYEFENSISAIVDKKDLEKLEKDPRVKDIKLVGVRNIFLQDTPSMINATKSRALQANGINLTGRGQSICIIDSGINYSHPDLGGCWGNNNLSSNCKIWGGIDYCADNAGCSTQDSDPIDVHGHGTHVSGIAAANGTINGIAPEARIIMIKACNSTGSCYDDAISSGINWCISNASIFNISVISMSLGGGSSTGYCNDDPLAPDINNAVGNNIPVVIATGNNGFTTKIAAPACVQNATPITSVRKNDATMDYNRNSLVKLAAPGYSIYSTYLSGYSTQSGTSMATPHVAGAIAIIRQFLNLTGQTKTPKEIEGILNNTGKKVDDSGGSGYNFSRINVYSAIISLDNSAPNVTLVSPPHGSVSLNANQIFRCNASDLSLKNITFYLWNSSGVFNQTIQNVSGGTNNFEINISNLSGGSYKWNCLYTDENNNMAFASSNFSLVIGGVSVNLLTPESNNYTNINNINFSCSASSDVSSSLSNLTLYLWNSSSLIYTIVENISGFDNSSRFNYSFVYEDSYIWNCRAFNNNSNSSFGENNFTIIFDATRPTVNLINPENSYNISGESTISFGYNVSDNFVIHSCNLILNNQSVASNSSAVTNQTNNISYTLSVGSYSWGVNCTDRAGNAGNSSIRSLTVSAIPVTVSSGSGGGGGTVIGGGKTYNLSREEASGGYTTQLNKNDKIKFEIFDEKFMQHTLVVNFIGDNFINISILEDKIDKILGVGQGIKLNLSSDEYYELFIRLDEIINNKAKLTIQTIKELIIKIDKRERAVEEDIPETKDIELEKPEDKKQINFWSYIEVLIIAILVLLIIKIMYLWRKQKMKEEIVQELSEEIKKPAIRRGLLSKKKRVKVKNFTGGKV